MAGAERSRNSDLAVRTLSAIVMIAVTGTALWLGGWVWTAFVGAVGVGVLWEWSRLAFAFERRPLGRGTWLAGGLAYVGVACLTLLVLRSPFFGIRPVLAVVGTVIAVDVCAYFAGRTLGGPKIAPAISPSKTWAGLAGGALGATVALWIALDGAWGRAAAGPVVAIVAQAGDFFESWMKRRAGVKDSSNLIPGHGGLFDRVDGLMAVLFAVGIAGIISSIAA